MAKGRIIVTEITRDKRVNDLSDDTSRLAFTWLITFADSAGRTHGDPALVRSALFPRRTDVSTDQVEAYLKEWHECGLVNWYEAEGDLWLEFPSFHKHQKGFDRRHEPDTVVPDPPMHDDGTYQVQAAPVQGTGDVPAKRSRSKVEKKTPAVIPPSVKAYQDIADVLPVKSLWDDIESTVGKDIARWQKVVRAYCAMGWNKRNIKGMVRFFARGEIPGDGTGSNGRKQVEPAVDDSWTKEDWSEETVPLEY
jgi:hypothetical protein